MGKNENIEIKRILDILKSKRILIISVLIIFTILGYIYSSYCVVPKYKSSTTLLIIPNSADENRTITNSDLTLNSGLISTYSNIAKNSKVLKQVINNLGLNITESQLLNNIKISVIKNTHIMEITVTDSDPQKAFNITKELASVFLDEIKQIYNIENIGIVDEAQLPKNAYNNNYIKDIAIFFIIGMLISAFYVMMIYIFDNTVKTEEDIENYIKVKALGSIPIDNNKNEIIERNNAKSYVVECINTIRTNILYMNSTKSAKTILVTSCTPREGKSWTSANIATAFAETNKKVLLIDADMRKGRANKIFDIDNTEGLSNYLYFITGNTKKDIELGKKYIKETQIPNLHILTNGTTPPNPSELLDSEEMKELMTILKNVYDIIIIDAPPCKLVTDSIILSTIVDSTILVADSQNTKIADLSEVKKSIDIVGGKVIGAILNKVKISAKTYGKSYYYGHDEVENDKSEIQEKTIISVSEVINKAIEKLKERNFDIYFEENEIKEEKINDLTENNNDYIINEIIKNQNQYLQKMANSISDIKVQINNNLIKNKTENENITKKIEELQRKNSIELKEEIRNTDNKNEVNKISEQLEELKLNYEEILPEIRNNDEKDKLIQELTQGNLKEEQVREILKEEIANIDYARKVNEI